MTIKVHPQHFNGVHTASDKSEDPLDKFLYLCEKRRLNEHNSFYKVGHEYVSHINLSEIDSIKVFYTGESAYDEVPDTAPPSDYPNYHYIIIYENIAIYAMHDGWDQCFIYSTQPLVGHDYSENEIDELLKDEFENQLNRLREEIKKNDK